jgi:hypothetical protein
MSWFRSRSRLGAYLALFALAFQLAVSSGHVHLERIVPLAAGASALAGAPPSADDLTAPSNPAGREHPADDHCPICTLIISPAHWCQPRCRRCRCLPFSAGCGSKRPPNLI